MNIEPYTTVSRPAWEAVCAGSSQAWLFHRAAWVDIEERIFVKANCSFGLRLGDRLIGVHPLYLGDAASGTGGERLLHSGIHRHTGLALVDGLDGPTVRAAQSVAIRNVFSLAESMDVDRVQLNSHNLAPLNLSPARREIPFWVEEFGFFLGLQVGKDGIVPAPGMATCNADQIVDLGGAEEELFRRLDNRQNVRKAQAAGLVFEIGEDESCVDSYYAIARRSASRTGEQLPPADYYRTLWRALKGDDHCAVLFTSKDGTRLAGLFLVIDKNAASFLAGVSDPEYLPLRVNDFLHWSAMVWAKRKGLLHYRLGPIFPELPASWPVSRVSAFKSKFGARSFTTIQGSFFRRPEKYVKAAITQLRALCEKRAT
jgi:hypothetical protein